MQHPTNQQTLIILLTILFLAIFSVGFGGDSNSKVIVIKPQRGSSSQEVITARQQGAAAEQHQPEPEPPQQQDNNEDPAAPPEPEPPALSAEDMKVVKVDRDIPLVPLDPFPPVPPSRSALVSGSSSSSTTGSSSDGASGKKKFRYVPQLRYEPSPFDPPAVGSLSSSSSSPPSSYPYYNSSARNKQGQPMTPLMWLEEQQQLHKPSFLGKLLGGKDADKKNNNNINDAAAAGPSLPGWQTVPVPKGWDGGYGWVFVKYHPSPFEVRWREESKRYNGKSERSPLCRLLKTSFKKELDIYMANLPRMPANGPQPHQCPGGFPSQPRHYDPNVFSRFEYRWRCTRRPCRSPPPRDGPRLGARKYTYIEPLVGLLRHPGACSGHFPTIVNKNYMIVDPWSLVNTGRSTTSPTPRVQYYDGGASLWDSGAGGASQSWFVDVYNKFCLNMTDFYMWEAIAHDPKHAFAKIEEGRAGHVKPGFRWYNIPLTVTADSWDNPVNTLLASARKEDVVIFKIDFDSPGIERALIEWIIKHPIVATLIDEFFYEDHVKQEILEGYWGTQRSKVHHGDSLKLFDTLRKMGIRAHSWV